MLHYVVRRVIHLIPTLLAVSFIVFALVRMIPGDPALAIAGPEATPEIIAEIREALGLNRPLLTQYAGYLAGLLRGDLGASIRTHQPVWADLWLRLPATLELAAAGMLISLAAGIGLGVAAALRPGSWTDMSARFLSLFGVSSPTFATGLLFMLVFGYYLRLFPIAGSGGARYLVLPAVTAALTSVAFLTRLTRASLIEVLAQDYVRTARAKGLALYTVVAKHALPNAVIAPVTVAGLEFGRLITGVVVLETIFARPGIGKMLVDAIQFRDFPVIQGLILVFAVMFALVNVGVDLAYAVADPRIRLG
ncbi:MAG: ABC transporter permease [Armatimonadetes bacterium]|nr:ABC transporter permease [Armatimonadota bacterium]